MLRISNRARPGALVLLGLVLGATLVAPVAAQVTRSAREAVLVRSGLSSATNEADYQTLASVPSTGSANTPGVVRRTDSTISNATINNASFGYWLQCVISGAAGDHGIGTDGARYAGPTRPSDRSRSA